jgi:hypothetical protein
MRLRSNFGEGCEDADESPPGIAVASTAAGGVTLALL